MLKETVVDEKYIEAMRSLVKPISGKGLLENASSNVLFFAEYMLGFKLYSWQIHFLDNIQKAMEKGYVGRKEFLALTSRQIGKSTSIAILALWSCVFNKYPGTIHNNTTVGIFSASDIQARKLLSEIRRMVYLGDGYVARTYIKEGESVYGTKFFSKLLSEKDPNNTTTITFMSYKEDIHGDWVLRDSLSGSCIKSYPPTSSVLGETFSIVIEDEAGKSDKLTDEFHYDYAYPTGNSTDAIRIYTSTPWTPSGFFYRLADPFNEYDDHPAERLLFTIESIQIENPDYYIVVKRIIDQLNSDGKTNEVQRAYYCRFVKGEDNYFNPDKVQKIFKEEVTKLESFSQKCDMGIDFGGQVKSRTVITIVYYDNNGIINRIYDRAYPVGGDLSLIEDVEKLRKLFNVQRIIPDDCPAGDFLIRTMKEKGWDVQPMNFKADKVKKYGSFRAMINKERVYSYLDDELKTEMLALETTQGLRNVMIAAPPGYTDDKIDSFVMASYFYLNEEKEYKFIQWNKHEEPTTILARIREKRRNEETNTERFGNF
jgi:hypothetical protein